MLAAGSILGATVLGTLLGLLLKTITEKTAAVVTAVSAGVMLCASVHGLVLSALERWSVPAVCMGLGVGAVLMQGLHIYGERSCGEDHEARKRVRGLLFVFAIASHHVPEGLAAGVSFGTGDCVETLSVCTAIALQTIPETMMILPAMGGFPRRSIAAAVAISGGAEVLGLLLGYCVIRVSVLLLPWMLAVAAGAMLFVIFGSMLSEAYEQKGACVPLSVLGGYCGMLLLTALMDWMA